MLIAITLWWMAAFSIDTPAQDMAIAGLLLGFGTPITFIPTQLIAFATLPVASRTAAGVLLRLAVNVGGTVGISQVVSRLARSAPLNQSYLSEYFTDYLLDRWQIIGTAPGANVTTAGLVGEASRQALAIAYSNDFRSLAATSLICPPQILLMRKVKKSDKLPT